MDGGGCDENLMVIVRDLWNESSGAVGYFVGIHIVMKATSDFLFNKRRPKTSRRWHKNGLRKSKTLTLLFRSHSLT